jgi:methionine-rich copper-binding protein CopC
MVFRSAVLAAWLVVLAGSMPAAAHGIVDRTDPRAGGIVKTPPTLVRIWFSGAIEPAYSRARVIDESGRRVDRDDSAVDPSSRLLMTVSLTALAPGRYRVIWRVLSVDSHMTEGEFAFRIVP